MSETPFNWPGQRSEDPAHRRVDEFLTFDIQQSPEWARELIEKTEAIANGELQTWERNGNAFYLELSADRATIEDTVDETSAVQTVSLDEFRAAVLAWIERIEASASL